MSSMYSHHIKTQIIRDKKYFVYNSKEYPVNFDILKINSNYFYQNQEQFKEKEYIELLDEKEKYIELTDESIEAFISSCQNEPFSFGNSSILPLQYLAHKYKFDELIKFVDKFIEDHSEDLIFETLFFKIATKEAKENNDSFFDTSKEEQIISEHLSEFLQKEEMLRLPINSIYHILSLFYKHQKNKDELLDDVTNFLFKCLDKYGRQASVLFNIIDFGEQRIEVVNRLLENYSDNKKFDFNLINKTLAKTVKELTSEVTKQKEEYSKFFKQMKETFQEQLSELKEMKKQEEEKQKQNEIENQKRINDFHADVKKIENDFKKQINFSQDQFKQICTKQEEFIDNFIVKKYHQIILETITVGQFRKFDDMLKDHFSSELTKNRQKNQEYLLHAKLIIDCISIPKSYDNVEMIQIFKGVAKDQATMKITSDKIEDSYQKGQLDSCLTICVDISKEILVEIEYPCNKFEQIMKIISDIKSKSDKKMTISVTINDKSYFEQKHECSKIINICKVGKLIEVIPEKAFCEFSSLSVLELDPNTVTIESSSFQNCSSLTQIKIPEKVTTIGDYAFENCSSLTEIAIPTSVKSIGDHCFEGCSKLDRMTINPFYTQIQFNTFNKCPSLKHFTVSTKRDDKLKTNEHVLIPYQMTDNLYRTNFLNSSELASYINECSEIIFDVQYPSDNFEELYGGIAKYKDTNKTKIKISIFIMEKTDKKFYYNTIIDIVRIDLSVKEIKSDGSNGSFQGCSSLTQISIPSSVISIGENTFERCSSLTQITIPSSVTSIRYGAFFECSSLTQITIPSSVTSIGGFAFYRCSSLTQISIPSSVTSIEENTFEGCSSLTQITILSSVISIGNKAFKECSSLTQITIPSSVTSIGNSTFSHCKKLDKFSITVCDEKRIEYIEDKFLVFKTKSTNEFYDTLVFAKQSENTIAIPSFINTIKGGAFSGFSSLAQITIPSSVTSIGNNAFFECSSLTQITIPSSVTSIGDAAFSGCSSLTQITFAIPSSVTSIGSSTFSGCSSLAQITIPSSVTSIGNYAFAFCKQLTQITFSIPSSITSIGWNAFHLCSSLKQITIPSSVTSIGSDTFEGCSSLKQITISSRINRNNLKINSNVTINLI